jgi:hypothetical protein
MPTCWIFCHCQTRLPDKKLLASKLHEFYVLNDRDPELPVPIQKPRKMTGQTKP